MHNTKLNALQQVNARLEIAKESVQELQDKLTRYKNNRGEVLMNYEEMISLLEDIYIVCDLNDDMPVTQKWHKKFSYGGSVVDNTGRHHKHPKVIIQVEDYYGNDITSFESRGKTISFVQKNLPSNWGIADIDDIEDEDGIVVRVQIEGNFTDNGKIPQSEINNLKHNLQ